MNIISDVLDNDFLDAVVFKDTPYFITFTKYPGLRLKVNPKGRVSYITYGRIRFGGNPRTITHGTISKLSISEAIDMHYQTTKLLSKGLDPNLIKKTKAVQFTQSLIFEDIAMQFLNEKKNNKEYSELYFKHCKDYLFRNKLRVFHKLNIMTISHDMIHDWYDSVSNTPSSANSAMSLLTNIFSYAVTKNYLDFQLNPINSVNRIQLKYSNNKKNIQMDLKQELPRFIYQLWDPLNIHDVNLITRYAIYMMLITGMKKNDVLKMKWSQVSNKKFIKIEKKNFIQLFPINNHIDDVLQEMSLLRQKSLIQNEDQYIFYNANVPSKPLSNIRKSLIKYSVDLEWVVFPEAIRKTFTKLINESAIPTHHYYYLLGLNNKTSSFNSLSNYSISTIELSKSLDVVHKKLESLSPMTLPGINEPLRYFLTNKT